MIKNLNVITFNVKFDVTPSETASALRSLMTSEDPSAILLQECTYELIEQLRSMCEGKDSRSKHNLCSLSYTRPDYDDVEQYLVIIYEKSWILRDQHAIQLSEMRRSLLAEFDVPQLGKLHVHNVHLSPLKSFGRAYANQAEYRKLVSLYRENKSSWILGGDFNRPLNSLMGSITRSSRRGMTPKGTFLLNKYIPRLPIDYILTSPNLLAPDHQIFCITKSDHAALRVILSDVKS